MGLRWDKLLEITRGEVKEESREIARLRKKYDSGEARVTLNFSSRSSSVAVKSNLKSRINVIVL